MSNKEEATPLSKAARQVIEAEDSLCEQIRSVLKSAFGGNVTIGISVKPAGDHINFNVQGEWYL
jgi:hypothetical protein